MAGKVTKLKIIKHDKTVIYTEAVDYDPAQTFAAIKAAEKPTAPEHKVLIGRYIGDARSIDDVVEVDE